MSSVICKHFLKGSCIFGNKCRNIHLHIPDEYEKHVIQEQQKVFDKPAIDELAIEFVKDKDGKMKYGYDGTYFTDIEDAINAMNDAREKTAKERAEIVEAFAEYH